jgi:hypothetical protein
LYPLNNIDLVFSSVDEGFAVQSNIMISLFGLFSKLFDVVISC